MTETRIDPFMFRGPSVEEMKNLTPAQQDKLVSDRRSEWERVKPLELARLDARRAHVGAGGDGEAFDKQWSATGEAEYISDQAKQRQENARRASSIF